MKYVRIKTAQQLKESGWIYYATDGSYRKGVRVIVKGMIRLLGRRIAVEDSIFSRDDYARRHFLEVGTRFSYHIYEAMTVSDNPIFDLASLYQHKEE